MAARAVTSKEKDPSLNHGAELTKMKYLTIMSLLFIVTNVAESYNILVVFPFPMKSHAILGDGYVTHLLNAGHQVTYLTPYPKQKDHKNLTEIDLSTTLESNLLGNMMNITTVMENDMFVNNIFVAWYILRSMSDVTKQGIYHEHVKKLLSDTSQKFDVVIAEWMMSELYAGFADVYDCPLIWSTSLEPPWLILQLMDEVPNPAYSIDLNAAYIPPLTFTQRVSELWKQTFMRFVRSIVIAIDSFTYADAFGEAAKKRGTSIKSFSKARYSGSFLLSNGHPAVGEPLRLPQNVKMIGGYHIDFEIPPLPEDLQKLMDDSKNGVIYFSLGTLLKSKDLPENIRNDIINVLGALNLTVIWKFEHDPNAVLPKNVHILQWAPQASILNHPNCVLFISHGGLLSLTESLSKGVPIIGIPGFGDQKSNIIRAAEKGYAKMVPLSIDIANNLEIAIKEVLSNPSYTSNAKYRSMIFRDRVVSPGKELVYWVEHVVKTGGATYLRSHALSLAWYEKMYLDLVIVAIILLFIVYYILSFILNRFKCMIKVKIS